MKVWRNPMAFLMRGFAETVQGQRHLDSMLMRWGLVRIVAMHFSLFGVMQQDQAEDRAALTIC